ncbi:hypothetical protein FOZ62_027926 [Perkinsus olseni]|uniref:Uncharacterized protein n=1 Tax=Perkinsus olseni TaxID=32597 RepID=A0A7J6UGD7_PEROL|nr:hypothetical protein FOZ62_027926 [Perkinsus olseni]
MDLNRTANELRVKHEKSIETAHREHGYKLDFSAYTLGHDLQYLGLNGKVITQQERGSMEYLFFTNSQLSLFYSPAYMRFNGAGRAEGRRIYFVRLKWGDLGLLWSHFDPSPSEGGDC